MAVRRFTIHMHGQRSSGSRKDVAQNKKNFKSNKFKKDPTMIMEARTNRVMAEKESADCRLPTADCRLPTAHFRSFFWDGGNRIGRLPTADGRLTCGTGHEKYYERNRKDPGLIKKEFKSNNKDSGLNKKDVKSNKKDSGMNKNDFKSNKNMKK